MDAIHTVEETTLTLSYDDGVVYEDQFPTHPANDVARSSLADRIGTAKIYLLSETTSARPGKRKHENADEDVSGEVDMDTDEDATYRANAILFHGPPIAHLPTARLFAYATHFDSRPMGLEWIDDNTCVFVFETKAAARSAQRRLQKSATEEMDVDGFVTAKPIPVALWPPEERINKSLGKGEGLKGTIRMRWAKTEDVKKKGAKKSSEFYKKHGTFAGKEGYVEGEERPQKRRRASSIDQVLRKAQLDEDLDRFLADEDDLDEASPPLPSADSPPPELASRMRSDYIADDGRTLLDPPSGLPLADRIMAPLPRRTAAGSSNGGSGNGRWRRGQVDEGFSGLGRHSEGDRARSSRNRPRKSQRELDDELEAFLNERS